MALCFLLCPFISACVHMDLLLEAFSNQLVIEIYSYIKCVCLFYQADFPSVAGLIEDLDSQLDADDITGQGHKEKKYYIDTVNIKIPRKGMEMTGFLRDGMGECWL